MDQEDVNNLVTWLQSILKDTQETKASVADIRAKVDKLPEIESFITRGTQDSGDAERKIEDTRARLESKIDKLDQQMNDLRSVLNDIKSKVERLN